MEAQKEIKFRNTETNLWKLCEVTPFVLFNSLGKCKGRSTKTPGKIVKKDMEKDWPVQAAHSEQAI